MNKIYVTGQWKDADIIDMTKEMLTNFPKYEVKRGYLPQDEINTKADLVVLHVGTGEFDKGIQDPLELVDKLLKDQKVLVTMTGSTEVAPLRPKFKKKTNTISAPFDVVSLVNAVEDTLNGEKTAVL
jgi:hypothetical protein